MKQELIPSEVVGTPNCLDWFFMCKVLQGYTTLLLLLQVPCVSWRNIYLGLLSVVYIRDNSYLPGRSTKRINFGERKGERREMPTQLYTDKSKRCNHCLPLEIKDGFVLSLKRKLLSKTTNSN